MKKIKIFAIILLLVIGGAILTVYLVGRSQPEEYTVKRAIRLHLPVADVWKMLAGYDNYTMWRMDLDSVSLPPEAGTWVEYYKGGKSNRFQMIVVEPERQMIIRLYSPKPDLSGEWTFHIQPEGDQISTRLSITETGVVTSPFARAFGLFKDSPTETLEVYLTMLADHLNQDIRWIDVK